MLESESELFPSRIPLRRKFPEVLYPPRYCCCGHKLKGEERAYYSMGRWTCPNCIKADKEEIE